MTFDDGLESQYSVGVDFLNEFGFKGTFFIITQAVGTAEYATWDNWRSAADNGHEIGSHSQSHPYLTSLSFSEMQAEVLGSQAEIDSQIESQECLTFAYPYGNLNGTVEQVVAGAYIGARGVGLGFNTSPFDFFNANTWFPGSLEYQADLAEQSGVWMIVCFHGLDGPGSGYDPVTRQEFRQFLNHISTKDLWVDTFGAVTRYLRERESANLSVVSFSSDAMALRLTDNLDDNLYAEELTIRSEVPASCDSAVVTQDGKVATVTSVWEGSARVIYFNAIPDRGEISVVFSNGPITTVLSGLAVNPASVAGGSASQGTVMLSGPAPSGGAVVTLSDDSTAVSVPPSITVPAGSSSTTFPITTSAVTNSKMVTISATYDGATRTAKLTLVPAFTGQVESLTLVNAETDQDIGMLSHGDVVDLAVAGTSLNIRANVSGSLGSVRFELDGNPNFRTESAAPYALAGGDGDDYASWTPSIGSHSLTATPYSEAGGAGMSGSPFSINFTVVSPVTANRVPMIISDPQATLNPVTLPLNTTVSVAAIDADGDALSYAWSRVSGPGTVSFQNASAASTAVSFAAEGNYILQVVVSDGQAAVLGSVNVAVLSGTKAQVVSFTLVNAETDEDIGPLADGDVVDLAVTGTSINIRANVSGVVGSVRFGLDGNTNFRTESTDPYAIAGGNGSDYESWTPALGSHRLTATPYSASGGMGMALIPLTIGFTVTNSKEDGNAVDGGSGGGGGGGCFIAAAAN